MGTTLVQYGNRCSARLTKEVGGVARRHGQLVAARFTAGEKAVIELAARIAGVPVSTFIRSVALPAAEKRIRDALDAGIDIEPRPVR